MVPQVLLGAVNGIETVAMGALQLARNVLVSAVSGAADIGAEAVTATFAGTRGVVAAAPRMVGDIATTAQRRRTRYIQRGGGLASPASPPSVETTHSGNTRKKVPPTSSPAPPRRLHGRSDRFPSRGPRVDPSRVGRSYTVRLIAYIEESGTWPQAYKLPPSFKAREGLSRCQS